MSVLGRMGLVGSGLKERAVGKRCLAIAPSLAINKQVIFYTKDRYEVSKRVLSQEIFTWRMRHVSSVMGTMVPS